MEKPLSGQEIKMINALSMGMFGRLPQNRCTILNKDQLEILRKTAREVIQKNELNPKDYHQDSNSFSTPNS